MFVYLTNNFKEEKEELKKYAGKLIAKSKDNNLEVYERNEVVLDNNNKNNICERCGSVSNFFKEDFRDIAQGNPEASGLTKYHSCPGCFALSDESFWSENLKKEHENLIKECLETVE